MCVRLTFAGVFVYGVLSLSLSRYGPTPGIPGVPYFPNMVQEFFDLIPPALRPRLTFFIQTAVF